MDTATASIATSISLNIQEELLIVDSSGRFYLNGKDSDYLSVINLVPTTSSLDISDNDTWNVLSLFSGDDSLDDTKYSGVSFEAIDGDVWGILQKQISENRVTNEDRGAELYIIHESDKEYWDYLRLLMSELIQLQMKVMHWMYWVRFPWTL